MLLSADFLRYWLHRAYHEVAFMWPFHAVHHSPHKLYWMNVNRFHPLDKASQYIFDAMPFVLLGVSEEVLALYFVFYAVNGFFQHCNIDVRLGVLNYVVSGPELHRWRHSIHPEESNQNYGNNLIVWDDVCSCPCNVADWLSRSDPRCTLGCAPAGVLQFSLPPMCSVQ